MSSSRQCHCSVSIKIVVALLFIRAETGTDTGRLFNNCKNLLQILTLFCGALKQAQRPNIPSSTRGDEHE